MTFIRKEVVEFGSTYDIIYCNNQQINKM